MDEQAINGDVFDEDEIDQAEIEEIKQHAVDPSAPRTVMHYFIAPSVEAGRQLVDALNAKYGSGGANAGFVSDAPQDEDDIQIELRMTALVSDEYVTTIREIESFGRQYCAEYGGWRAEGDQ